METRYVWIDPHGNEVPQGTYGAARMTSAEAESYRKNRRISTEMALTAIDAETPKVIEVYSRSTPGAQVVHLYSCASVQAARDWASDFVAGRRDLRYQDVEIRYVSGQRIEFAGPVRAGVV